ncbi:MAG: PQQ-binding-like beta-propeller repeat protein [Ignavibacteria bacterium]|nr:PQQ-binding-like beta-propeller repeat protein [Ignavibacteria bacterium]
MPTGNKSFLDWQGGIVGSPAVNTLYSKVSGKNLAAVNGIDGYLYLIDTDSVSSNERVTGFDGKSLFATPIVYDKFKMGASISSPLMINDVVIAGGYNGLHLFRITPELKLELVDLFRTSLEATPIVYDGRIYVGSRDGYLYCFGD